MLLTARWYIDLNGSHKDFLAIARALSQEFSSPIVTNADRVVSKFASVGKLTALVRAADDLLIAAIRRCLFASIILC